MLQFLNTQQLHCTFSVNTSKTHSTNLLLLIAFLNKKLLINLISLNIRSVALKNQLNEFVNIVKLQSQIHVQRWLVKTFYDQYFG